MCTQFTWIAAAVLSVVFCILWPVLTIPAGVFSKSYFYFFVIISIIWGLIAAVIAIFLPLWESRDVFARCAEIPIYSNCIYSTTHTQASDVSKTASWRQAFLYNVVLAMSRIFSSF